MENSRLGERPYFNSHPILTFCIYGSTHTKKNSPISPFNFLKVMHVCVSVYLCLCMPDICQCKSGSEYGIQSPVTEIKGNYEPPVMGARNSHPTGRAANALTIKSFIQQPILIFFKTDYSEEPYSEFLSTTVMVLSLKYPLE